MPAETNADVLSHFNALDELIQLIYQGSSKFVLLSSVDRTSWNLHLGLAGPSGTVGGRWWRAQWGPDEIARFVKSTSPKLLEAFAERLAETVVQGELYVGNWPAGDEINLTFGPTAKTPIRIPFVELSAQEAAAYATRVFTEIAVQAQSRKCRLHPSLYHPTTVTAGASNTVVKTAAASGSTANTPERPAKRAKMGSPSPEPEPDSEEELIRSRSRSRPKPPSRKVSKEKDKEKGKEKEQTAEEEIEKLRRELAKERAEKRKLEMAPVASASANNDKDKSKTALTSSDQLVSKAKTAGAPRPLKGASLANPNKKARRYQAISFDSD